MRAIVIVVLIIGLCQIASALSCANNFVCDPSVGTDIFIKYMHMENELLCEQACQFGHPNNPCKFFTWVPDTEEHVPNCFQMTECVEKFNPTHGEKSGAWSCEDESIFCPALDQLQTVSNREAVWKCDHGVHPYGDTAIFQDVSCRVS